MIRTALQLAERGLHVFPCRPARKEPGTEHGFKDATTDPIVIQSWWRQEPLANIGVAAGQVSGFFAVDVDSLDAEGELRKLEARYGALPPSIEVITARGRHIWFQHPGGIIPNTVGKVAAGIDVRADGGYVLAPPSLHPTGRRYAWSVDCAKAIAVAPAWLLGRVTAPAGNGAAAPTPPSEWRELAAAVVPEGARDSTVTKLAGYLLRRSVDAVVTLDLLQIWNAARCAPPLPAADIERIVASIAGKELKRRGAGNGR